MSAGDGYTCCSNILDFYSFNGKSTSFIAVNAVYVKLSVLGDFWCKSMLQFSKGDLSQ